MLLDLSRPGVTITPVQGRPGYVPLGPMDLSGYAHFLYHKFIQRATQTSRRFIKYPALLCLTVLADL